MDIVHLYGRYLDQQGLSLRRNNHLNVGSHRRHIFWFLRICPSWLKKYWNLTFYVEYKIDYFKWKSVYYIPSYRKKLSLEYKPWTVEVAAMKNVASFISYQNEVSKNRIFLIKLSFYIRKGGAIPHGGTIEVSWETIFRSKESSSILRSKFVLINVI